MRVEIQPHNSYAYAKLIALCHSHHCGHCTLILNWLERTLGVKNMFERVSDIVKSDF